MYHTVSHSAVQIFHSNTSMIFIDCKNFVPLVTFQVCTINPPSYCLAGIYHQVAYSADATCVGVVAISNNQILCCLQFYASWHDLVMSF